MVDSASHAGMGFLFTAFRSILDAAFRVKGSGSAKLSVTRRWPANDRPTLAGFAWAYAVKPKAYVFSRPYGAPNQQKVEGGAVLRL